MAPITLVQTSIFGGSNNSYELQPEVLREVQPQVGEAFRNRKQIEQTCLGKPPREPLEAWLNMNANNPLLSLPAELLMEIIRYLPPRDTICLSISCRSMFHGILNANKSTLWFRAGRFQTSRGKKTAFQHINKLADFSDSPEYIELDGTPTILYEMSSDFRKILVDIMLGISQKGCQLCLRNYCAGLDFFVECLGMRLCECCMSQNVLPQQSINSLTKIKPSNLRIISHLSRSYHYQGLSPDARTSTLQLIDRPEYNSGSTPQVSVFQGVWRPHVQSLVWAEYGMDVALDSLLEPEFRGGVYRLDLKTPYWRVESRYIFPELGQGTFKYVSWT